MSKQQQDFNYKNCHELAILPLNRDQPYFKNILFILNS